MTRKASTVAILLASVLVLLATLAGLGSMLMDEAPDPIGVVAMDRGLEGRGYIDFGDVETWMQDLSSGREVVFATSDKNKKLKEHARLRPLGPLAFTASGRAHFTGVALGSREAIDKFVAEGRVNTLEDMLVLADAEFTAYQQELCAERLLDGDYVTLPNGQSVPQPPRSDMVLYPVSASMTGSKAGVVSFVFVAGENVRYDQLRRSWLELKHASAEDLAARFNNLPVERRQAIAAGPTENGGAYRTRWSDFDYDKYSALLVVRARRFSGW